MSTANRPMDAGIVRRRRDDEDSAVVLAVLFALSARTEVPPAADRTFWGDPAFTLGSVGPQRGHAWWASGLPR